MTLDTLTITDSGIRKVRWWPRKTLSGLSARQSGCSPSTVVVHRAPPASAIGSLPAIAFSTCLYSIKIGHISPSGVFFTR